MIIDFHTHTFPDELAARALATLVQRAQVPTYTDATNDGLRAVMRGAGVDLAVVAPIATRPAQVRAINAWAVGVNQRYPDLCCLGTLHPALEDWPAEIERMAADGLVGVKLHPDYQDNYVDDPVMLPMYRALAEAGLLLLVHAGVDIGLPPPVHCPPERLARVLDAVPELTVVAAHMGGYAQWDAVEQHLVGRNLYFDTSYSFADLGAAHITALIRAHTPQRILFATDSPWTDQATEIARIRSLELTTEEKEAILGGNAERLLTGFLAQTATRH